MTVLQYFSQVFCSQQAECHASSSFLGLTGWCLGGTTTYNATPWKGPQGRAGLQKLFTSHINQTALSLQRSLQFYLHFPFKGSFA